MLPRESSVTSLYDCNAKGVAGVLHLDVEALKGWQDGPIVEQSAGQNQDPSIADVNFKVTDRGEMCQFGKIDRQRCLC